MRNEEQNTEQRLQNAGIAALAAASKTPFKTAFLVSMGIFAAHLLAGLIGLSIFAGVLYGLYSLLK